MKGLFFSIDLCYVDVRRTGHYCTAHEPALCEQDTQKTIVVTCILPVQYNVGHSSMCEQGLNKMPHMQHLSVNAEIFTLLIKM